MDSYSSTHLLTGRQLRQLRQKGLTASPARTEWVQLNEALISASIRRSGSGDHDGRLFKPELRALLGSIGPHLSARKVHELAESLADGADSVDAAALAHRLADEPTAAPFLIPGGQGLRYGSGETIFHTSEPSDFAVPKPTGRRDRTRRWHDHGDILGWSDRRSSDAPTPPTPRSAPSRGSPKSRLAWSTTASEISATVGTVGTVRSRTPTAGASTSLVWKESNGYDVDHRRMRAAARPGTPAAARREPGWRNEVRVMPSHWSAAAAAECSAPRPKVLKPRAPPPLPPAARGVEG